jgi:alkanesulfonate monooxygenase SsuD/methylene tetrahydromethanopterin reductase-like flavin-dependent oxidoreductase (luciferase family)
VFDWIGVPLAQGPERVARLEESIRFLNAVAGEGPVTIEGERYTIRDYDGHPKPVQRPYPPLHIGAGGPRMLRLAAREADIVGLLPSLGDTTTFDEREVGPEAFDAIEFNILIQGLAVSDDRDAAIQRLRDERGFEHEQWFDSPMVFFGSVDHIVERMQAQRERYGISYYAVFEHQIDEFTPIVARLAGH